MRRCPQLAANSFDVPFLLIYLLDENSKRARLVCASGLEKGDVGAPEKITALKMIEDWKPDVVISDIGVPEIDGYDFMRRLGEGDGKRIPASR